MSAEPGQPVSAPAIAAAGAHGATGGGGATLRRRAAEAREWLFDAGLPFWWSKGFDRAHGGFFDLVGVDGVPVPSPKRTFVQARQVYSYLQGGLLGWPGPWREAVEAGLETLDAHCRSDKGGFVHRLDAACRPEETRRDLYDQAFVAFTWAHVGGALGREDLVRRARDLFALLDREWRSGPVGYWEGELLPQPPRRQNPHMHLLEAALAVASTRYAEPGDRERMNRYAAWFGTVFVDAERAVLPEHFDLDWNAIGVEAATTEPGHHFEWFWILERVRATGGDDWTGIGRALWRFGLRNGIDRGRNVAVDEVYADGRRKSAMARLWPQTERLKAALAEFGLSGGSAEAAEEADAAFSGLQPYLATPAPGAFFDKMKPDGSFVAEPARSSSLYHVTCAFSELIRVVEQAR